MVSRTVGHPMTRNVSSSASRHSCSNNSFRLREHGAPLCAVDVTHTPALPNHPHRVRKKSCNAAAVAAAVTPKPIPTANTIATLLLWPRALRCCCMGCCYVFFNKQTYSNCLLLAATPKQSCAIVLASLATCKTQHDGCPSLFLHNVVYCCLLLHLLRAQLYMHD